jgi:hypothetical protein
MARFPTSSSGGARNFRPSEVMNSKRAIVQSPRPLVRLGTMLASAAGALLFGGCTSMSDGRDSDAFGAMAPVPASVRKGQEMRSAEAAATRLPGA